MWSVEEANFEDDIQSYILTNDVVLNKDDLNDLLLVVLCE